MTIDVKLVKGLISFGLLLVECVWNVCLLFQVDYWANHKVQD